MEITTKHASYKLVSHAAKMLIHRYKNPRTFLCAATDQIQRMSEFYGHIPNYDNKKDHSYSFGLIIQEIVPAWYEGGEAPVESIARAIYRTIDYFGADGFLDVAMDIMGGIGVYGKIYACTEAWYAKEGMEFARTLLDMAEILEKAWEVYKEERRNSVAAS